MSVAEVAQQATWLDVALLRQGLYRLLAGVLQPPTAAGRGALRDAAPLLESMPVADFPFAVQVLPLLRALQEPCDLVATNVEHVRLFESGVDGALCPPSESYYLQGPVGSAIGELQRDCMKLGLRLRQDVGLEPDHVAALLEVHSALCAVEARAWHSGDVPAVAQVVRQQRWFLERHLGRWVTAFARRIRRAHPASPYREAGEAVAAVVRTDRQLLTALATRGAEVLT